MGYGDFKSAVTDCMEETIDLVNAELVTEVPNEFWKGVKDMKETIEAEIRERNGIESFTLGTPPAGLFEQEESE